MAPHVPDAASLHMDDVILCPFIQKYITELKQHPREYSYSGVCDSNPDDCSTSSPSPRLGDRFTLHAPYCKTYLRWEIIFNKHFPHLPPDLVLDCGSTGTAGSMWFDVTKCRTLQTWERQQGSFAALLEEVLQQFRAYQEELVCSYPNERLHYEYNTVCGIKGVEFFMKSEEAEQRVRLMIPLTVDFSAVFSMLLGQSWAGEQCHFFVEFGVRDGTRDSSSTMYIVHSEIHWPTLLVPFAWLVDYKYPVFALSGGNCLIQFIPELESCINTVISNKLGRYCRRKELCETLVALFGHPLEYDAHQYTSISFLFNMELAFLVHVTMGENMTNYPAEAPLVCMCACMHGRVHACGWSQACKCECFAFALHCHPEP